MIKRMQEDLSNSPGISKFVWILGFIATVIQILSATNDESLFPSWLGALSFVVLIGFCFYVVFFVAKSFFTFFSEQTQVQYSIVKIEENVNSLVALGLVDESVDQIKDQQEIVYEYLAARYGFGYRSIRIECIIGKDGNAQIKRFAEVEAFGEVEEIDTTIFIDESDTDTNGVINVMKVLSTTPGREVSQRIVQSENAISAAIQFSPPLQEGETSAFELIEELPSKLFAISKDDADERLSAGKSSTDYFGWTILQPTRKLRLTVYFPDNVGLEIFRGEVRYASTGPGLPGDRIQHNEQKSIKVMAETPVPNRSVLKLNIDYPMNGLVYVLTWKIFT